MRFEVEPERFRVDAAKTRLVLVGDSSCFRVFRPDRTGFFQKSIAATREGEYCSELFFFRITAVVSRQFEIRGTEQKIRFVERSPIYRVFE